MYRIVFTEQARKDLKLLHKKAPLAVRKLAQLLDELKEHPPYGNWSGRALKGL